ncbi:Sialidase [Cladochytrium replicatum]|nr:Sialidase [Cladochytrium replicatum]
MRFFGVVTLAFAAFAGFCNASPLAKRDLGPVTVFTPPSNYTSDRTLYARSLMLTVNDTIGTLLMTWENYSPGPGLVAFPIYRSLDHGFTWSKLSTVADQVNGWGLRYQPHLYELPRAFAGYPAGTILLAGNSIPTDLSLTKLDIYASIDKGVTWTFVSSVASGGRAVPDNGQTPVWEPFLYLHESSDTLICYYSDQRDSKYGQKIVHQVSKDLVKWGPVVDDFASPIYSDRPGMPTIALLPNGKYIMTYEHGGAPEVVVLIWISQGNFAIFFKIAADPFSFGSANATVLRLNDNTVPTSSPYVIWTPVGGSTGAGTIVVSAYSSSDLFLNQNLGAGPWTRLTTPAPSAYSRHISVGFKPKDIVIVSGGRLGEGPNNKVTFSARDVNGCQWCG